MAGRGGRGAALLQALEKPTRPPGQGPQNGQNGRGQPPPYQQGQLPQQQPYPPQQPLYQPPYQQPPRQQGPPQHYQQPPHHQYQQRPPYQQQAPPPQQYPQPPYQQLPQQYQQPQGRGPPHQGGHALPGQPSQSYGRGAYVRGPVPQQPMYGRGAPPVSQPYDKPPSQPQGPPLSRQATPPQAVVQPLSQQYAQPSSPDAPIEAMSRMAIADKGAVTHRSTAEKGTAGKVLPLSANYIPIYSPQQGVFQYCVTFDPVMDSKDMRYKLLHQHRDFIGQTKAFDGITLYLPRKLEQEKTDLISEHPIDKIKVKVTLTLTRVVPPDECLQVYNVLLRRIMKILKMQQVGRYYYDPSRPAVIPQHKIELWPGYITSIQHYEGGLMLLCDVSHRLLRTETVMNFMIDMYSKYKERYQEETMKQLIGNIVLTRYNNKTYRVDDIEWNKNPLSTFTSHNGEEITYIDYYRRAYGVEITDMRQPLLVHRPKKKDAEPGRRKTLEIVCLIPELCSMTGLTDAIRQDFRVMKDISAHTRVGPMQRLDAMKKFIQNINSCPEALEQLSSWGLKIDTSALQTEGRQLAAETIHFGNSSCSAGNNADWGRDATRQQVISAVDLHTWMIVFVKRDQSKALEFISTMKQVTPVMGIGVRDPHMIELRDDRTETYLRSIRENLHPRVQMVVIIFPTSRDDRYAAVKKLCCVESPIPSQVINARTISQANKLRSVTQKIALQINVKLGGTLWEVEIPSKSLMVVGIDVYHDAARGGRSVGGVVCSINQSLTRWYSRVCFQSPGQELMDGLKMALTASLKKYHEVNNTLPTRIVVFRDGVGDGQLKVVSGYEVEQLSECFALFGEAYVPKLTVIVVQKRINTRLFQSESRVFSSRCSSTLSFRPDFFLVSQNVRQGTVTPTHYVVVHNSSNWKLDIVQKLTYKLTHLYYNWPGTVSVPAPCQYAHKLAFQVGQSIHAEPSHELSDRLFFL
uniref:Putative piwi-1 n=1 Tax=Actinia equina TaxID=6106 RepID=A0A2S1PRW0_ACTEQ|nr:putative piwi-1 [Actinia equina]